MPIANKSNDYSDLAAVLQATINPLVQKLQTLETKVDGLNTDRVTRTDLEKLRSEIVGSYVPRDAYEARHTALIDRNLNLENTMRELRKDYESDVQRLHERLESGKIQLETRIKDAQQSELSAKDRNWIRGSQIMGYLAILLAILDFLLQHIKFN
jgi:Rad3-related DNA helicase